MRAHKLHLVCANFRYLANDIENDKHTVRLFLLFHYYCDIKVGEEFGKDVGAVKRMERAETHPHRERRNNFVHFVSAARVIPFFCKHPAAHFEYDLSTRSGKFTSAVRIARTIRAWDICIFQ